MVSIVSIASLDQWFPFCTTSPLSCCPPQGFIMKLLACALTLLLAVGSQAFAIQSDAPSQLEHVQTAVTMYLNQVKDSAQRALDHLDGTEYAEYKVKLSESMDKLQDYAQTLTPYSEAFSTQFLESTKQMRERVMADMEDLRTQLEPKRQELHEVLQRHSEEYRAKLEPIIQEYMTQSQKEVDSLRARLQPVVDEMRTKMEANVEETKTKLVPMIEAVRSKLTDRLEELKNMATPYVEEYKERLTKAVGEVKDKITPHTQDMQTRLEPYMEDLKTRFMSLYETIAQAVQA